MLLLLRLYYNSFYLIIPQRASIFKGFEIFINKFTPFKLSHMLKIKK